MKNRFVWGIILKEHLYRISDMYAITFLWQNCSKLLSSQMNIDSPRSGRRGDSHPDYETRRCIGCWIKPIPSCRNGSDPGFAWKTSFGIIPDPDFSLRRVQRTRDSSDKTFTLETQTGFPYCKVNVDKAYQFSENFYALSVVNDLHVLCNFLMWIECSTISIRNHWVR